MSDTTLTDKQKILKAEYLRLEKLHDKALREYQQGNITKTEMTELQLKLSEAYEKYAESINRKERIIASLNKGKAGDINFKLFTNGLTESEVNKYLPDALQKAINKLIPMNYANIKDNKIFLIPAFRELYLGFVRAGQDLAYRMMKVIESYLPDFKLDMLQKAGNKKPTLISDKILDNLIKELDNHYMGFAVSFLGKEATKKQIKELKKLGLYKKSFSFPEHMYKFRMIQNMLGGKTKPFHEMLGLAQNIPLSEMDKIAINYLEENAGDHVTGLTEKIKGVVKRGVRKRNTDAEKYKAMIRENTAKARNMKWGWKDLSSELGRITGDWGRDWDRIARTELKNADLEAQSTQIQRLSSEEDPIVYKMPMRSACTYCKGLLLHNYDFDMPRLFKLSALRANGSNVNRKTTDWLPVAGSIHPNCLCDLRKYTGYIDITGVGEFGELLGDRKEPEVPASQLNKEEWWGKVASGEITVNDLPKDLFPNVEKYLKGA